MKKSALFACFMIYIFAAGNIFASTAEPRTPIPASQKKYTSQFVITRSGSYFLAGNRLCDTNGIVVEANNVTIDLRGFTLTGNQNGSGIYMLNQINVEVSNGTISDFNYGIDDASSSESSNHRIIGVRVKSNTNGGIKLNAENSEVRDCLVTNNGTSVSVDIIVGILVSANSIVTGCNVNNNGKFAHGTIYGICGAEHCLITGNTVYSNGILDGDVNSRAYGINAGAGSIISGNTVSDNGALAGDVYGINASDEGCSVISNTVCGNGANCLGDIYGIYAGYGTTITGNSVYNNGFYMQYTYGTAEGLYAGPGSTVIGNTVHQNGKLSSGTAYGIHLAGNNLVNQNTAYNNGGTNMNDPGNCTFGDNHAP